MPATSCHSIEQWMFDEPDLQIHTALWKSALSSASDDKINKKGSG